MDRMKDLIELIRKYDIAYEEGNPLITDTEYDRLYNELILLEKQYGTLEDSPTTYIQNAKINHLKRVKHDTPMLSQEKCHTKEEIESFVKRTNDNKYIIDLKLDGVSISLKYKNGLLNQAVTRGNGIDGYDITAAALLMEGVPKKLTQQIDIEVRGEVLIKEKDFEELNINGEFKNSRNLVAGTLNALDVNLVKERRIYVCVYDIRALNNILGQNMSTLDSHLYLNKLGFNVVNYWTFDKDELNKMTQFCLDFNKNIRPSIECKIDGLVIKSNNEQIIKNLGNTNKYPKSSIAFKFDSQDRTSVLKSVEWQVGRTGLITPVANFDTIEIDGVEISKASLANIDNINNLDIMLNDTIVVARSNDVIPKIISVVKQNRTGNEIKIQAPLTCPNCGYNVSIEGPLIYCHNEQCSSRILQKLSHFVTRDAMCIADLSDKILEKFIENNIPIQNFLDIYEIEKYYNQITNIKGFKVDKKTGRSLKVDKLLKEIEKSKNNYLHQLLFGLSISNVGLSKAKAIASQFENLNELINCYEQNNLESVLISLDDFGDIIVKDVINFFDNNLYILKEFNKLGIFPSVKKSQITNSIFTNKTIVISGELTIPRKEVIEKIEGLGAKNSGSVSSKTDYLLIGNDTDLTSNKCKKAIELGIKIITEDEFNSMI